MTRFLLCLPTGCNEPRSVVDHIAKLLCTYRLRGALLLAWAWPVSYTGCSRFQHPGQGALPRVLKQSLVCTFPGTFVPSTKATKSLVSSDSPSHIWVLQSPAGIPVNVVLLLVLHPASRKCCLIYLFISKQIVKTGTTKSCPGPAGQPTAGSGWVSVRGWWCWDLQEAFLAGAATQSSAVAKPQELAGFQLSDKPWKAVVSDSAFSKFPCARRGGREQPHFPALSG